MNMISGSVFNVSYKTSWENEELIEENHVVVVAKDAEEAIEKAKKLNSEETYFDEEEKAEYRRDTFSLLEVSHITDLDG